VEPKETPFQGVAINTRIRKLNFPPFVKDLFCGVFNKSVLSYAEVRWGQMWCMGPLWP
jgi:hypothetical protein